MQPGEFPIEKQQGSGPRCGLGGIITKTHFGGGDAAEN
ncbi:predicted protein [Plenodomus lingam JN3]|uniref:Predicted protein n=1 Tax=Leptosphaeria maculans (strain JN3 / isolate v23.1.3 / race Av1-4-5-6-7-8) TaxID=985895 RepID=E4ZIB8_LEPMJ|nr:predicted protein [Plenodomus lingam JN3]CBX90779.1 predicted protein [Plenodomus lingam JN3]